MILNLVPGVLDRPNVPGSLSFRHPDYQIRWWWREFYRISYLGGREYYRPSRLSVDYQEPYVVTRNAEGQLPATNMPTNYDINNVAVQSVLFRHNREKSWEFENRRKRASYLNFIQPITKSLVSHAMKKAAVREGPDAIKEFWKAVDCEREEKIDDFVREGSRWAQVMGIMWACVDQDPESDDKAPYAYWVNPLDIFDWGMSKDGKSIAWLKQFVYTEGERTWEDPIIPFYRFRVWTTTDVTTYEIAGSSGKQVVGRRPHSAGRVPFVPLFSQRDKESVFPDGTPIMGDACKVANAIYNYGSLKDEIGYKQTFSWLAIPDKRVDTIQIGLNTCFAYDPQTTNAVPTYISPDPEQARVLMEYIQAGIEQLRQMLGVGRGRQEGSMQKPSADALELEDEDKRSILGDIAAEAQSFELRLANLVQSYIAKTDTRADDKITVKYADDFDLRSFSEEVQEFLTFNKIGLSPEVNLKGREDLVKKRYAELPPDELDALVASMKVQQQKELDAAAAAGAGERVTIDPSVPQGGPGTKPLDGTPGQGQSLNPMGKPTANRPPFAGSRQPMPPSQGGKSGTATGAADPGRG